MQGEFVALLVLDGLARRRISRQQLASDAKISLSTLEKGLAGERPFTLSTIVRLEDALDVSLREPLAIEAPYQASPDLGAYRQKGVEWLVGTYLTLRPSFEQADAVYAYLTQILWDDEAGHLVFCESARVDAEFAQHGVVSLPFQSGQVHLVTNSQGQYRLITLSRPSITGSMYGLLNTLRVERGGRLTPITAPIVYLLWTKGGGHDPTLGLVAPEHSCHVNYKTEIDRVLDEEFGAVVSFPGHARR